MGLNYTAPVGHRPTAGIGFRGKTHPQNELEVREKFAVTNFSGVLASFAVSLKIARGRMWRAIWRIVAELVDRRNM